MAQEQAAPSSFEEVAARLDEIVSAVRRKDTSLEDSLDLLDEAIRLGGQAVSLVDSVPESAGEGGRATAGDDVTQAPAGDEGPDAGDAR